MRILAMVLMTSLVACGGGMNSMLDAQGKAQAKTIRAATAKLKDVKGAEGSVKALNGLAKGLENGSKSMQDVDKLVLVVTDALKDGSVSADEAKAITAKIGKLSKNRGSSKKETEASK